MSNPTPEPNFNPFAAPAVAAKLSPDHPNAHLVQYRIVRLGLQLIYYSIAAMAALVILTLVTVSMAGTGVYFGIAALTGIGVLVALLVSVIGYCMCGACPQSNEKPFSFTAIACLFAFVGSTVFSRMLPLYAISENNLILSYVISLTGNIAYVACSILFCLLLRRIGSNISSELLRQKARSTLIWFLVMIGCSLLFVAGAFAATTFSMSKQAPGGIELIGVIFALTMTLFGLITFFKYLAMLRAGINELDPNKHVQT